MDTVAGLISKQKKFYIYKTICFSSNPTVSAYEESFNIFIYDPETVKMSQHEASLRVLIKGALTTQMATNAHKSAIKGST